MATVFDSYFALSEETTYGTAVAPTRFYEFVSEGLAGNYQRVEGAGLRAGTRVQRSDRFVPSVKGAGGDVKFEVLDKSFGIFLKHMLGTVTTTGAAAPYTHAGTVGSLQGKSLTLQVGRVDASGVNQVFTYEGAKVASWELTNAVDAVLNLSVTFDSEVETVGAGTGAYAAVTPTYPTGSSLFTFSTGSVTIGGTTFAVNDLSLKGDNSLKTDRFFLGNVKKEPLEDGFRKYDFSVKGAFDGLTQYNRVAAATAAGTLATMQFVWTGLNGAKFQVDVPAARFDAAPANVSGPSAIDQDLSGVCLFDGTNSPVTITYMTTDTTP